MKNVYKIKIDSNNTYYIDLPLEVGRDTGLYRASLGHKVNHSFTPNCRCCRSAETDDFIRDFEWYCRYRQMQHPRWGEIVGIFTTRTVKENEEFLCNYGYDIDTHLVPDWYRAAWETHQSRTSSINKQG